LESVGNNDAGVRCFAAGREIPDGNEAKGVGAVRRGDAGGGETLGETGEFFTCTGLPEGTLGGAEELVVFGKGPGVNVDGGVGGVLESFEVSKGWCVAAGTTTGLA
jgi:hypothetical protein